MIKKKENMSFRVALATIYYNSTRVIVNACGSAAAKEEIKTAKQPAD
ncbi:hypothetical protein [Ruminococcus sp.]|nr:hypothetical protein [Ruminococcus sp.]MEE1263015.1 hypothetical protein [Ruminococcus sp.]